MLPGDLGTDMPDADYRPPIVVGIDGSKHSVRAAIWAVDEAVSRGTHLLLVCVIDPESPDLDAAYDFAHHALHKAWTAAEATGQPVKLQSTVLEGDPVTELTELSRKAEMICVGSSGTSDDVDHDPGSTAAALARGAFAPVAIVRRRHTHRSTSAGRWIVAALDPSPRSHAVLDAAFEEALLRKAPILALTPWGSTDATDDHESLRAKLERYLAEAHDDDADVQISTLPIADHIANLIAESAVIDQLVIIGPDNPTFVEEMVAPEMRKVLRQTDCSMILLRNRSE
jgi:nucleotide-binding universal stress UspA family protein